MKVQYKLVKSKQKMNSLCSNKESESAQSLEMTVKPHSESIHCCVFSSDGKTILSSSSDGTAKVENLHTSICITVPSKKYPSLLWYQHKRLFS